jgi:hypothetical protein
MIAVADESLEKALARVVGDMASERLEIRDDGYFVQSVLPAWNACDTYRSRSKCNSIVKRSMGLLCAPEPAGGDMGRENL